MWPCITPIDYFPMLDPTLKASRASSFPTIRLLDNDMTFGSKDVFSFVFKATRYLTFNSEVCLLRK